MAGEPYPKPAPRPRRKWRKPLPFASPKRVAERDQREWVRQCVIARDRTCRAGARIIELQARAARLHRCTGFIDDVHEIKTRARGGSYLDAENCIGVCRTCHRWITEHPVEARRLGLVRHSWEN